MNAMAWFDGARLAQGMLVIALAAAFRAMYYAYIALRAKRRVRDLIRNRARDDVRLRAIIAKAGSEPLSPEELAEAIRQIEATAVSLPKKDREIMDEGTHQHSASGTKRFVRDLLAA
jgi:hypothetical protein